ncbi:MAG: flavodoxin domain-containing protein [Chloroflexi bacterium]|nr:flavodoxin domain-containing protein [Chloroflexota bacterium]
MNTRSVLLVYATRYGSTQEVAESISATLREAGIEVELQPMVEVKRLDTYDAVVLGAAIYNARWHPEAHQFLSQYQETLRQRPVAIFALGPLSTSSAAMLKSSNQLQKELEKYPWLKPVALEVFVGKLDSSKMGFFERVSSPPASDHMDWDAIRAWANALPARLQHDAMLSSQINHTQMG